MVDEEGQQHYDDLINQLLTGGQLLSRVMDHLGMVVDAGFPEVDEWFGSYTCTHQCVHTIIERGVRLRCGRLCDQMFPHGDDEHLHLRSEHRVALGLDGMSRQSINARGMPCNGFVEQWWFGVAWIGRVLMFLIGFFGWLGGLGGFRGPEHHHVRVHRSVSRLEEMS